MLSPNIQSKYRSIYFGLQQVVPVALFQDLDDTAYLLSTVAGGGEEGVRGIDHDQILDADQGHDLAARVDEVVVGIEGDGFERSEERRVGKECRSRWSP